jgi:tRNA-modifying protein YgfZ
VAAGLTEQVRILREEVAQVRLDREVVLATGDGVVDYLQGQLSQEIEGLEQGRSAWTFVLQPQGKVDAWFRVSRLDETTFVFDIDAGWSAPVVDRLERFRLRTPVTFERVDWQVTAVRGARALDPSAGPDPSRGIVVPVEWPGEWGWDLIGAGGIDHGPPECSLEALEVLRIEAGRPRMGHELDASTIPAESGVVPISVSFTKGCYTGQELVARIESRGSHTPRRLVGLHLRDGSLPDLGSTLEHDGNVVGRVTSVSAASSLGHPIGLAYLARAVAVPAEVQVTTPEGPVAATAVQLPLLASGSV